MIETSARFVFPEERPLDGQQFVQLIRLPRRPRA